MENISQRLLSEVAYNLLNKAATRYPRIYLDKLISSLKREECCSSKNTVASIIQNILYAAEDGTSLCQDTGMPTFHIYLNPNISIKENLQTAFEEAAIRATENVPLRKNVIEPFSFFNPGNNIGWGVPLLYFHYSSDPGPMKIRAELKGGGGEIKSSLDWIFTSTENMENAVLAYAINNVLLSKGENCIPGFIGIGVGGCYASEAMFNAKNAVYRDLTERTSGRHSNISDKKIASFEKRIFENINKLGLGPMGNGGKTTTLGVFLERRGTHTAVAPVAVCHQCWALRASEALIQENKVKYITPHLAKEEISALRDEVSQVLSKSEMKGNVYEFSTPIKDEDVLKLNIWDIVYLNGKICTSRDGAHRRMVEYIKEGKRGLIPNEILNHGVIYHCGPIIGKGKDHWIIKAAGPTTSSRFTDDASFLVENGIFNVMVGKGTMGKKTVNALKGRGVYLEAVGGCAVSYKNMITQCNEQWLDLGYPEAVWAFDVSQFGPLIVSIDSKGNSLTENIMEKVYENARAIYKEEGLDPYKRYVQYPQTFAGLSLEEVIEKGKMG